MADFTSTTHNVFIPDLWTAESQMSLEANLVMGNLVLVTNEVGSGNRKGDVLHKPKVGDLTAQDIADNADITGEANTEGEVTLTLNKKKHASVYIQKHIVNNLSAFDLRKPYTHKIGYALGKRMNLDIIAAIEAIGSPHTAGVTGAGATNVTEAFISAAEVFLDVANVELENRGLVFYPNQRSAIKQISRFSEQQTMGSPNITAKSVPDIHGMPVFFTSVLTKNTSGGDFDYNGFLLHKEAVWMAKPVDVDMEFNYIPRRKAWLLSGDSLYGIASYRGVDNFCIIYTDSLV